MPQDGRVDAVKARTLALFPIDFLHFPWYPWSHFEILHASHIPAALLGVVRGIGVRCGGSVIAVR